MTADAHPLVEIRDGIAPLTMNRPERLNALTEAMIDSAIDTLERIAAIETYQQLLDREGFSQRRTGGSTDHREGVAAFVEKRAPKFTRR